MKELKNKIIQVLDRMEENIPAHVIPIQSEDLHYQIARIYGDLEEKEAMRSILETLVNHQVVGLLIESNMQIHF